MSPSFHLTKMAEDVEIPLTTEKSSKKQTRVRFQTPPRRKKQCGLCPEACYEQNFLTFNCFITILGLVSSAGAFIGLMTTVVRPHLFTLGYIPGNCTTVNFTWTGEREECLCSTPCAATYPCLIVRVKYKGKNGKIITSMLHADEHVFTYKPHCSYQPPKCSEGYNPNAVTSFFNKHGIPGSRFPCVHSPTGPGALSKRTLGVTYIINVIFWPGFLTIVFAVIWCVLYFYCCNRKPKTRRI